MEEKTTNKEKMFFIEDVRIDPLGHVGCGPQNTKVIGGAYAEAGYYGFQLPKNSEDYDVMIVHMEDVEVS